MKDTVVAFGEVLWDILPTGKVLGGAPANFVYRIGTFGRPAFLVSAVGRDELGDLALEQLRSKGLCCDYVQRVDAPTGTVDVTIQEKGDASYVIHKNVAYDRIELDAPTRQLVSDCAWICFGSLIQRGQVSAAALQEIFSISKAKRICDINLRSECYSSETVLASVAAATVLKLNNEEVPEVAALLGLQPGDLQSFARQLFRMVPMLKECVVTMGGSGATVVTREGQVHHVDGYQVKVVDTVGCGDSFTAAYLDARMRGLDVEAACLFGNQVGALVAQEKGGMAPVDLSRIAELQRARSESPSEDIRGRQQQLKP